MTSASFSDRCTSCGRVLLDTEGTVGTVLTTLCSDCAFKRSRQHVSGPQDRAVPLPKVIKEFAMKWIHPWFFGTVIIDGVMRIVKRMTKTSAFEFVTEEEKAAIHSESEAERSERKRRMLRREDSTSPDLDPSIASIAASLDPGEEVCIFATTDMATGDPLVKPGRIPESFVEQPYSIGRVDARDLNPNPIMTPQLKAEIAYAEALAAGDGAAAAEATDAMVKITRAANQVTLNRTPAAVAEGSRLRVMPSTRWARSS